MSKGDLVFIRFPLFVLLFAVLRQNPAKKDV